ncbi:MAG: glycosyltransferase family 1 protein [Hymenobacter sp.]|nr:MAG: glycosyltransferase family 1 protein [Hymenobacter sp.]
MITLVTSRFQDNTPDRLLLQDFEQYCAQHSTWHSEQGPLLFSPGQVSSRLYTALHLAARPFLKYRKKRGAIISLGLPYRNYLFSKTFPYFALNYDLRVLWTYDVWEPRYAEVAELVRESRVGLLLLSSWQATEHFRGLNLAGCTVQWVPETINPATYRSKPWAERTTNLLSFGRSFLDYHRRVVAGCQAHQITYKYQEQSETKDVATQGMKTAALQFPTEEAFLDGLADAQICLCFPRSLTHPQLAGEVSTLTLRYLQAMAAKCLVLGAAPLEATRLFGYNPVVEVDWQDPVGQLQTILRNPAPYQALIERNYAFVCSKLHYQHALNTIHELTTNMLAEAQVVH